MFQSSSIILEISSFNAAINKSNNSSGISLKLIPPFTDTLISFCSFLMVYLLHPIIAEGFSFCGELKVNLNGSKDEP